LTVNRATQVYILVVGLCALGVWAILRAGRRLEAPPEIGGAWLIEPAEAGASAADLPGERMWVEQSGLYFQFRFARPGGGGRVLDLKATEWPASGATGATRYLLTGEGWEVSARLSEQRRSMRVRMTGPEPAVFVARRSGEDIEVAPAPPPRPVEPPPPDTHHAAPDTRPTAPDTRPAAPETRPTSETEPASRPSTGPAL
jgi:hypothetical protein